MAGGKRRLRNSLEGPPAKRQEKPAQTNDSVKGQPKSAQKKDSETGASEAIALGITNGITRTISNPELEDSKTDLSEREIPYLEQVQDPRAKMALKAILQDVGHEIELMRGCVLRHSSIANLHAEHAPVKPTSEREQWFKDMQDLRTRLTEEKHKSIRLEYELAIERITTGELKTALKEYQTYGRPAGTFKKL